MMGRIPYDHYYYHGSFYTVYVDCVDSIHVRSQWHVAIRIHGTESISLGMLFFSRTPSKVKVQSAVRKHVREWLKQLDSDMKRNFYVSGDTKYDRN